MTPEQFELLYTLKNREIFFAERCCAAWEIGQVALYGRFESGDVPLFYHSMVDLWRGPDINKTDGDIEWQFDIRKKLANVCWRLSLHLPEGQKFFKYFPRVNRAEGFEERVLHKLMTGLIKPGYGTSFYEFHWEYPIEGAGIRKDLISVITDENERIPMLDWCRQNNIIVFCNRCGLEITYEVSKDCPYSKWRYNKQVTN